MDSLFVLIIQLAALDFEHGQQPRAYIYESEAACVQAIEDRNQKLLTYDPTGKLGRTWISECIPVRPGEVPLLPE